MMTNQEELTLLINLKSLLINWIMSNVRVFMHNVSPRHSSPYSGNFVSGHVNLLYKRVRYSTT